MAAVSDAPEEKHEAWSSYSETVLIFASDPEMVIDLREPVSAATRNALSAIGLGQQFAILTSHNPCGEVFDDAENARRLSELEADLQRCGLEYLVMDACSPDRSHCECSVAIKIDRDTALRIAVQWEQVAIFWWDLERFWIYWALESTDTPVSLPKNRFDTETTEGTETA